MDDIFFRFLTRDSSPPDAIPTRRGAPLRRWGRGLLAKEGKILGGCKRRFIQANISFAQILEFLLRRLRFQFYL